MELELDDGRKIHVEVVSSQTVKGYMFIRGDLNSGRRGGNKPSILVLQKNFVASTEFKGELPQVVKNFCDHIKTALPEFMKADSDAYEKILKHAKIIIENHQS